MTDFKIYTRVYSPKSAGQLASGKGPNGPLLTGADLEREFSNHSKKSNKERTALISVSDRIIDTVQRAFTKFYIDGEASDQIWIAFIKVPRNGQNQPHRARNLAHITGHNNPILFTHEWLFEWAIPMEYVSHQVSLQTLMGRGLDWNLSKDKRSFLSTSEIQASIANRFPRDPWEIGLEAGFFAKAFGARAPLSWIAHQYFYDCAHPLELIEDVVKLNFAGRVTETVDYSFFCEVDDGIETAIIEWWLVTPDFERTYALFVRWQDRYRTLNMTQGDESVHAAIEAKAVEIGL